MISPININSSAVTSVRCLPPRPVPRARKCLQRPCQESFDTMKSVIEERCTSQNHHTIPKRLNSSLKPPVPSEMKKGSNCTSNILTLERPHVLHRSCALNPIQLEKLANSGSLIDIVIVYSKECRVSGDWARYFKSMFAGASYTSAHLPYYNCQTKDLANDDGKNTSVKVQLQEIEAYSTKVYQMNTSLDYDRYDWGFNSI